LAMRQIIQVLGPTGVGKSRIAIKLAQKIDGEIISADSMQVYRDFDIGTAKIGEDERGGIAHHLIDMIADCSQFNAAVFLKNSFDISEEIIQRGRLPIVCGGTALYLRTMIRGIFPEPPTKKVSRQELDEIVDTKGLAYLWERLKAIDPEYAEKIRANDRIRIVRAMEIYANSGVPPSEIFKRTETPFKDYRFWQIGLHRPRQELYRRIEKRVDRMMASGLVEEVKRLRQMYPASCPPFKSLGYKEIAMFLDGAVTLERAVDLIKQHTRNFAKRQLSWFRQEKDIDWFGPDQYPRIEAAVLEKLWKEQ
jgi:tRNA dimethylallyltransferase